MSQVKNTLTREGRTVYALSEQDVEPILERNKELQKQKQKRGRSFHHAAQIPNIFYSQWMNDANLPPTAKWNGPEMEEIVAKKLKDPDWKFLRTDAPQQTYTHGGLSLPARQLILPARTKK